MVIRVHHICALAILCVPLPQAAQAQGYPSYPYSIMTPERGSGIHQRAVRHRGASARRDDARHARHDSRDGAASSKPAWP
jgi:hypothetical protein